jgi:hypothetical protein
MGKHRPGVLLITGLLLFIFLPGKIAPWGKKDAPGTEQRQTMTEPKDTGTAGSAPGGQTDAPPGEIVQIRGRIRLVGNMPFPRLVITDESDRDWYLEGADRELLAAHEQRTLMVSGQTEYQDIILANGTKAGVRRFLRDVRIIENPFQD